MRERGRKRTKKRGRNDRHATREECRSRRCCCECARHSSVTWMSLRHDRLCSKRVQNDSGSSSSRCDRVCECARQQRRARSSGRSVLTPAIKKAKLFHARRLIFSHGEPKKSERECCCATQHVLRTAAARRHTFTTRSSFIHAQQLRMCRRQDGNDIDSVASAWWLHNAAWQTNKQLPRNSHARRVTVELEMKAQSRQVRFAHGAEAGVLGTRCTHRRRHIQCTM